MSIYIINKKTFYIYNFINITVRRNKFPSRIWFSTKNRYFYPSVDSVLSVPDKLLDMFSLLKWMHIEKYYNHYIFLEKWRKFTSSHGRYLYVYINTIKILNNSTWWLFSEVVLEGSPTIGLPFDWFFCSSNAG